MIGKSKWPKKGINVEEEEEEIEKLLKRESGEETI